MYLLMDICNSSGVLRTFYILKIVLNIALIVLPIIVIVSTIISAFKVILDGKSDTMTNMLSLSFKRLIAALIVFFIPTLLSYAFEELVDLGVDSFTCITNANLEYIEKLEQQEALEREETKKANKKELEAALKEREALEKSKNEVIKQQIEKYNTGGALEGEILSSGTSGTYFAPFQGGSHSPSGASVTGGCSNETPVYHDISAKIGTPVYAPYDGTAKYIQSNCNGVLFSFGNQVRVYKEDGTYITYAHFSKFPDGINMPIKTDCTNKSSSGSKCGAGHCTVGMTSTKVAEVSVKKGQLIGYTGTTGNSLGPHLHVEIHEKGSKACVTDPWAAFGMR